MQQVTTGTDNAVMICEFKQIGPRLDRWLFVIERDTEAPDMFVEWHSQESYEKRLELIRSKGYKCAAYNISAIEEPQMLSLDDFLKE